MTEFPVYAELLNRGATDSPAGWLLPGALVSAGVLAAALIGPTFVQSQSGSLGEAAAAKALVDSPRREAVRAVEVMKIVPADVLGTGVSWSPLTGDGSS
jgi:hypothetical protein